ncbi:MAG: hypothetical protein ABJC26_14820, partial [Gemmatimonadaceae bacterium]
MISKSRFVRLLATAAVVFGASGCAYYNGIYNSKLAAHKGDLALHRGEELQARTSFQESANAAETVLVRFPRSKWRTRALFLAGRGEAMSSDCEQGVTHLRQYLSIQNESSADREKARLALAMCDVVHRRLAVARARLDSLINVKDPETSRQARLWAARAAVAANDREAAARLFATLDATAIQWEFVSASMQGGDYARAESLLIRRAQLGDWRPDVTSALRELYGAGRVDGVEGIVHQYDVARLRDSWRVGMHYLIGDLELQSGRDSLARRHLFTARQLAGSDTVVGRESAARLAFMGMSRFESLAEIDTVIARLDSSTKRSAYFRRLSDQLLLYRMLQSDTTSTGTDWFLAAEVARDSLHAPKIAYGQFVKLAREKPTALLAPKALHAAASIMPDSSSILIARLINLYPTSSVATWLRGGDPTTSADFAAIDTLLRKGWLSSARSYADTLRKLREAADRARAAKLAPTTGRF